MPIYRVLKGSAFAPDDIKVLSDALDAALRELKLVDRTDPAAELVAKRSSSGLSKASAILNAYAKLAWRALHQAEVAMRLGGRLAALWPIHRLA